MSAHPQTRIVIRHLSGSKINQVEQIPLKDLQELTIGRDPSSGIAFDQKRDDMVSRQHAAIRIQQGDKLSFRLADLNSSNGTLLNGEPVTGEIELAPEDTIELGRGGPKFTFDVEPRPDNLAARTRVLSAVTGSTTRAIAAAATTATGTAQLAKATGTTGTGVIKSTVGKETVMRLLFQERQKSGRIIMSSVAAVLAVLVVAGGGLYWHNRNVANQLREEAKLVDDMARKAREEDRAKLGQTAKDIVNRHGNSTVVVDLHWRMYDAGTGKPLFHKVLKDKDGNDYPTFVRLPNGEVVRWLTLEDQDRRNIAIQESGSGSGFVINSQGLIMTNKHVAAGWMLPFSNIGVGRNPKNAALVFPYGWEIQKPKGKPEFVSLASLLKLRSWIPEDGGLVFEANRAVYIGGDTDNRRVFQGRNDLLQIRFPGNRVSMQASLVRASTDADAALIKVEAGGALVPVDLAEDDKIEVGDKVIVLGYPAISSKTMVVTSSVESNRTGKSRAEEVPEPTVTEGIVSLLGAGFKREADMTVIGTSGDAFQMSINATGAGNSGGPVFNAKGQVVGLFTYGRSREGDASVTLAVPIKHGRALLNPQRASAGAN
jgi:serine protease Do